MRSNSKHSAEELERYIQMYIKHKMSYQKLKKSYGLLLNQPTFSYKVQKYQKHEIEGISSDTGNNRFSERFKDAVVGEHLELGVYIQELARKYNIPAKKTFREWIIKYTKGKDFRVYSEKSEVYTMTGRKKTDDEKLLIVKDYLDGDLTYAEIAEKYNVSYNNIYSWFQKYKTH